MRTAGRDNVITDEGLRDRERVFRDRSDAGRALARLVGTLHPADPVVLAIPCGGVPVGVEVARALGVPLDLVIARKLQIPGNTEAGFGAVAEDGPVFLNEALAARLGLTAAEIARAEQKTRAELGRRREAFRPYLRDLDLENRDVIIVDDGIASGSTMMAAAVYAREHRPARVTLAAPTGHLSSVSRLAPGADFIVCPNLRRGPSFAVAEAYERWYDLGDEEVIAILSLAPSPLDNQQTIR